MSENTPLNTNDGDDVTFWSRARCRWQNLKSSSELVIVVAFVSYTLENLVTTTPITLYPAILKSVVWTEDPNCTKQTAENLIKGDPGCEFEYKNLTLLMGILVSAKPAAEIILSIMVGTVIDKCGHKVPMLVGCVFNAVGCIGFGVANNYWILIFTRVLQGLGSALSLMCASVLLAATFPDYDELSRALGIATVGLGLGAVLGWPFGAFFYELMGRASPFLFLALLCVFDGILRMVSSRPVTTSVKEGVETKFCGWCQWNVITDPFVFISLFNIFYYSFFISLFATFQPPMVFDRMNGEIWEIGTIVLIALIFQVILQVATGYVAIRIGLWKLTFIGFLCCGASYIAFTFLTYIWQVLGTELLNRVGHAFILSSSFVQFKIATEDRYKMSYGGRMTLLSMSYNLGIMLGPLVGGFVLDATDYTWLFRGLGISIFVFALPTLFLSSSSNNHAHLAEETDTDAASVVSDSTERERESLSATNGSAKMDSQ